MQYSHSRIEVFEKCKFKYKMQYLDDIETIAPTEADNAIIVGQALHKGIETDVETAIAEYYDSFPVITDEHITEAMKLEYWIPKAKSILPKGQYEVEIYDDHFIGYIDLLSPSTLFAREVEVPNSYDVYDFKYTSDDGKRYSNSNQLHLYKYFFERNNPDCHIRNMYFVLVPKTGIKQKKTENIEDFRKRVMEELNRKEIKILPIEYDQGKVIDWLLKAKECTETTEFNQNPSHLCRFCEFENFCKKGDTYMLLPKNERRDIETVSKRVLWIYGSPFCGKTTFANSFPDPLMLNTDGNIKFVDAPYIRIRDEVVVQGRMTKRTLAWEVFKDVVNELEKKDNTFKTIVVDLLEDLYEMCRVYMCDQMGITHESDDSFKAWDKVRSEFLNTLKRLMALDYENIILISHEDATKDITKKGGDKITSIKPNLSEKVATKVAGMVDVVARIVADGENRMFCFKSNEVIFGGGRLKVMAKDIPLDVEQLFKVYADANARANESRKRARVEQTSTVNVSEPPKVEKPSEGQNEALTTREIYLIHDSSDSVLKFPVGTPVADIEKCIAEGCDEIGKEEAERIEAKVVATVKVEEPTIEVKTEPVAVEETTQPVKRVRRARN